MAVFLIKVIVGGTVIILRTETISRTWVNGACKSNPPYILGVPIIVSVSAVSSHRTQSTSQGTNLPCSPSPPF